MPHVSLFLDVFANQSSLLKRLAAEFRPAARDCATDPAGDTKAVFKDHQPGRARRKDLLRFGVAIGLFVYATLFATTVLVWTLHARRDAGADKNPEMIVVPLRSLQPAEAPLARSDRDKDETGGG